MDAILTFIEVVRWFEVCGNGVQEAAGGSFYSSQNNSPYLANRFHWTFSALANQKRGFDRWNAAEFNQEWWFSPRRYDGATGPDDVVDGSDNDDSPPGTFFALVTTAFRRAFSQPNGRTSRAMASATLRLGVIASARRTVNLTSRLNRGSSLATPAFQAVRSRKSVRAFASENC